jgi:hypothetical protein
MVAIHPARRRRGIATEALRQVFSVARDEKHFEKVVARTQIGRPGDSLAISLGAVEVRRTSIEIYYSMSLESDVSQSVNEQWRPPLPCVKSAPDLGGFWPALTRLMRTKGTIIWLRYGRSQPGTARDTILADASMLDEWLRETLGG